MIEEIVDSALRKIRERSKTGFDAGIDFKLAAEAYRIHFRYLYDPLSVAAVGKIDVVPHQVRAVSRMLAMDRIRLLLADDVGLGKTVTVGLVIKELLLRGMINRVLIVVPSSLAVQWKRELKEKFGEEFKIVKGSYRYNPFQYYDKVITSMDYAKLPGNMGDLSELVWDVVVIDEAHHFTPGTQRYELGTLLAGRTTHLLLVTATPHDGRTDTFVGRLRLLNSHLDAHTIQECIDQFMIRRLKDEVTDFQGRKLFRNRSPPQTIEIHISKEEMYFYRHAEDYIRKYYGKAKERQNGGAELALIVLQRRIASSVQAGLLSLKKRLDNVGKPMTDNTVKELLRAYNCEAIDEPTRERIESQIIGLTPSEGQELLEEIQKLRQLIELAETIKDSKLSRLKRLIAELWSVYPEDKIIVFTEYKDTLQYVYDELSVLYPVTYIHGELSVEQKIQREQDFRDHKYILMGTDAAGEGLNLQFANIVINYELPWNPNRMEQRIGRVYRYGQVKTVIVYNFMASRTIEGEKVLATLVQKIEEIRKMLGDHAVDVIGSIVSEAEIRKIIGTAIVNPRQAKKYVETYFETQKSIIKEVEQFLSKRSFDLREKPCTGNSVTERDVERFLLTAARRFGNVAEYRGRNVYYFDFSPVNQKDLPCSALAHTSWHVSGFLGTFDKTNTSDAIQYVALGHPVVSAAIARSIRLTPVSLLQGDSLSVQIVCGITFYDRDHEVVHEEPVLLYIDEGGCQVVEISSVWDCRPVQVSESEHCHVLDQLSLQPHVCEQMNKIQERIQKKVDEEISRREELLSMEYNNKIQKKKKEMKKYQESGHTYLVGPLKKRISDLRKEFKRKSISLQMKKELTWEIYGPVATALVLPEKMVPENNWYTDEELKRKVERTGMDTVIKYEKDHNRIPCDVSQKFRGYDIESTGEKCIRYIEVKSFERSGTITMTEHEWTIAEKLGNKYFLYIVENALNNPFLTIVRDPYGTLADSAEKIPKESFEIKIKHLPGDAISIKPD